MTVSDLVAHARRELILCGQFESDPTYAQSVVATVAALMSYDGHSGGSMACAVWQLGELLQFRALAPLTDDPGEWVEVGHGLWQNRRDSAAFSRDGGASYRYVDGRTVDGPDGASIATASAPADTLDAYRSKTDLATEPVAEPADPDIGAEG